MLFSNKIPPQCSYCSRGIPSGNKILCMKKGVMVPEDACDKFRYDPLKRIPPRPAAPDFSRLKDDDFTL